ncbi:hypothetical protein [Pseudomonas sp. BN102]|uniref:hypothetical protein n=1 Tax=Pseudomonas sp. BN102 TaxID=2567886 RepID=UPI00245432E4|nr:hypothetical protein [Pseudomonas sp. BN102]MDH4607245.1 hypothetical protein [Pseudomonas sp. BN102]
MSSSDITRARPELLDALEATPGSNATIFLPLLISLSPHEQADVEEDKSESRISLVEVLHNPLDEAEQRNAEDSPSGRARPISPGLGG